MAALGLFTRFTFVFLFFPIGLALLYEVYENLAAYHRPIAVATRAARLLVLGHRSHGGRLHRDVRRARDDRFMVLWLVAGHGHQQSTV